MRDEEIKQIIEEDVKNRITEVKQLIEKRYLEEADKHKLRFRAILEEALNEAETKRSKSEKGPFKYIYINCLRTSIETETYSYIIRIMDERKYSDRAIVERSYTPEYLLDLIGSDKEYFEKLIMRKVIRAKKYEVKDFLREYIWDTYIHPIPKEIEEVLSELNKMEIYEKVAHEEKVRANYGEVLERLEYVWEFT